MKRGTIEHPKTVQFADSLGIEIPYAAGLLECLWHWVSRYTPKGNIGKFSNKAIAEGMRTNIDSDKLVDALTKNKFLDENRDHRLVVHDWHEHCDDSVHIYLARRGEYFCNGVKPRIQRISKKERRRVEKLYKSAQEAHDERNESAQPLPKPLPKPESVRESPPQKPKTEPPVESIVELYHKTCCPPLPRVMVLTDKRKSQIKARLKIKPDLEFWEDFFMRVLQSNFLCGRAPPGNGYEKSFVADLEWVTNATNFAKICEGKFDSQNHGTDSKNYPGRISKAEQRERANDQAIIAGLQRVANREAGGHEVAQSFEPMLS